MCTQIKGKSKCKGERSKSQNKCPNTASTKLVKVNVAEARLQAKSETHSVTSLIANLCTTQNATSGSQTRTHVRKNQGLSIRNETTDS